MRAVVISILTFRTLFLLPLPILLIVERGSLIIFYRYLVLNCECLSWIYCEALLRRIDIFRVIAYEYMNKKEVLRAKAILRLMLYSRV